MTLAELGGRRVVPKPRVCPRCGEAENAVVIDIKAYEAKGRGRAGTTATRSRTFCESCAVAVFESLASDLSEQGAA